MFTFDPSFSLETILTPDAKEQLEEYGLMHSLKARRFAFSRPFQPSDQERFFFDFFNDPEVEQNLALPDMSGEETIRLKKNIVPAFSQLSVESKRYQDLMPAVSAKFVEGENFKGCTPERIEGLEYEANYEIDKALFGGENYLFDENWRSELLNVIFMLLRSGGSLNQNDGNVHKYVELACLLYKGLVKPVRLEAEECITLKHIFAVRITGMQGMDIFPATEGEILHPSNVCLLIVDTLRRYCYTLYNSIYV